jgi:NAD(P)-dependent dehydrogenase (short-subunit alcohol dehydrogenase family)
LDVPGLDQRANEPVRHAGGLCDVSSRIDFWKLVREHELSNLSKAKALPRREIPSRLRIESFRQISRTNVGQPSTVQDGSVSSYTGPMSLAGKVAIVTGASSGIGRATANALASAGAAVVAVGREKGALELVVAELGHAVDALAVVADLTADEAPDAVVSAAVTHFGAVDVLVNAAGMIGFGTTDQTTDDQWDAMMALNLRAPFRLMRAAFPHLEQRRGAVVNVSSVNGRRVFPNLSAYNTSKGALDHLTRCAAIDWAPHGVRVNAVNPGVTVTNLHRRAGLNEEAYASFLARSKETHPLGRPGEASEIAALIVFLASDQAQWITGETIAIDGGRHLTCAR